MVKGWNTIIIGEIASVCAGGTPSTSYPEYWGGSIPWMNSGELNMRRVLSVQGRITEVGLANSSTTLVPEGCVLIGLAGQGKTRGTVAINYIPLCTNQSIAAIFPNKNKFNTEYLYQNLKSRYEELRELSTGDGGRGGLNLTIIKNLEIPYPQLNEQNDIAEALFDADSYIAALEKLIAKKKAIKVGAMQELLTGKRRLKGFVGEWKEKTLGAFGVCIRGVSYNPSVDLMPYKTSNSTTLLRANNIIDGYIEYTDVQFVDSDIVTADKKLCAEDIVIAMSSGSRIAIGKSASHSKNSGTYCVGAFCAVYRSSTNGYIKFLFQSSSYRRQLENLLEGTSINNLNGKQIESLIFPFPPTDEEQAAIAEVLSDMDLEIDALTVKLNKAKAVKVGMMQQLLTGQIRLVSTENQAVTAPKPAHNKEFEDAVIISAIVNGFYNPQYPLGRVKITKLRYLLDRKRGMDVSSYKEKAAGPYDPSVRYSGGEAIAKKNGYITISETKGKGAVFGKGAKIAGIQSYINNWGLRADIDWLVSGFKFFSRDDLEVLATVDNARLKLEEAGQDVTVKNIVDYILQSPEWQAKREREEFADDVIAVALNQSKELFS